MNAYIRTDCARFFAYVTIVNSIFCSHGTECAGVIGMEANNNFCGVGVVHEAKVGGNCFIHL